MDYIYLRSLAKVPADCNVHGLNLCQLVKVLLEKSCSLCPHRRKESQPQLASNGYNQYVYSKVPEKLIKSVPGHKSSQALQVYEWPTVTQKQAVSRVLTAPSSGCNSGSYLQELQNNQLYVWCNLPHYVLQYSSLLLQHSNLPQLCNTAQYQHCIIQQLDSSLFISSMFNGLSNCTTFLHSNLMWIFTQSSKRFE